MAVEPDTTPSVSPETRRVDAEYDLITGVLRDNMRECLEAGAIHEACAFRVVIEHLRSAI